MPWWASLLLELAKLLIPVFSHVSSSDDKKQAVAELPGKIQSALRNQVQVGAVPDTVDKV